MAGLRLVTRKGICARMRVLRRSASYDLALDSIDSEFYVGNAAELELGHDQEHTKVTTQICRTDYREARVNLKKAPVARKDGRKPAKCHGARVPRQNAQRHAALFRSRFRIRHRPCE